MRVRAFAKINLSLRVLGTRTEGYHELRTIFQSLALHDTLAIRRARGPFRLECDDPNCPVDATNLIARAAAALWKAAGRRGSPRDVAIAVTKRIPMAAGLGGGSSDAAAALRALARVWRVEERVEDRRLPDIAASLGADVPYFLEGGTVLGLERGDLLFPLIDHPRAWVTLVVPTFGVSTKDAYAWWDEDGERLRPRPTRKREARSVGGVSERGWGPASEVRNDLQTAVAAHHPEIARIASGLRRLGATHAAMTGSGSAVFGLFDRRAAAARAAEALATRARRTLITRTVTRAEYRALAAK